VPGATVQQQTLSLDKGFVRLHMLLLAAAIDPHPLRQQAIIPVLVGRLAASCVYSRLTMMLLSWCAAGCCARWHDDAAKQGALHGVHR
jgi:hypothetical protein